MNIPVSPLAGAAIEFQGGITGGHGLGRLDGRLGQQGPAQVCMQNHARAVDNRPLAGSFLGLQQGRCLLQQRLLPYIYSFTRQNIRRAASKQARRLSATRPRPLMGKPAILHSLAQQPIHLGEPP